MKIYDCFIFNDELDLLELRLKFLEDTVDYFVLVESERTLSGKPKPLNYQLNKERFDKFLDKIIHVIVPSNDMDAWAYEFFQRNSIKNGLEQCANDDIIFISDADEIINIKAVLSVPGIRLPVLIELPVNYYFLNVKANCSFFVNLAANWSFIKDKDLGYRSRDYPLFTIDKITTGMTYTGWHFSYLFGYDISRYQKKISSFAHQEFDTTYYLNPVRIRHCVELLIDIFERPLIKLVLDNKGLEPLMPYINGTSLASLVYDPAITNKLSPANILFSLHKKYFRKAKYRLQQLFKKKH